jgi:hypothetical protein
MAGVYHKGCQRAIELAVRGTGTRRSAAASADAQGEVRAQEVPHAIAAILFYFEHARRE